MGFIFIFNLCCVHCLRLAFMNPIFFFFLLAALTVLPGCTKRPPANGKAHEFQTSKAGQTYQWSETEGKEFLTKMKAAYTTSETWENRAEKIRSQILRGTGLLPLPDKCPLNPILGDVRIYDGYQVQNVAFESLPGVYVTGSVYGPTNQDGKVPGILSA